MQMITEAKPITREIALRDAGGQLFLSIADRAFKATGDLVELELGPAEAEQLAAQLRGPNYSHVEYEDLGTLALNTNDWQVYTTGGLGSGKRQPVFLLIADDHGDEATARLSLSEARKIAAALTTTD